MPEPVRMPASPYWVSPDKKGTLYHGDCLKVMPSLRPGSFDLVFADPPFNIGYAYDVYTDTKEHDSYVKWTDEWLRWCARLLRPSGSLYVAIGDEYAVHGGRDVGGLPTGCYVASGYGPIPYGA